MATPTSFNLLGTPASPSSVAAAGSATSSTLVLGTSGVAGAPIAGVILGALIIGATAPTTAPTVAFQDTTDGTNFLTTATYVCANVANTQYPYEYTPPLGVLGTRVIVANGATTAITAWFQGVSTTL